MGLYNISRYDKSRFWKWQPAFPLTGPLRMALGMDILLGMEGCGEVQNVSHCRSKAW